MKKIHSIILFVLSSNKQTIWTFINLVWRKSSKLISVTKQSLEIQNSAAKTAMQPFVIESFKDLLHFCNTTQATLQLILIPQGKNFSTKKHKLQSQQEKTSLNEDEQKLAKANIKFAPHYVLRRNLSDDTNKPKGPNWCVIAQYDTDRGACSQSKRELTRGHEPNSSNRQMIDSKKRR